MHCLAFLPPNLAPLTIMQDEPAIPSHPGLGVDTHSYPPSHTRYSSHEMPFSCACRAGPHAHTHTHVHAFIISCVYPLMCIHTHLCACTPYLTYHRRRNILCTPAAQWSALWAAQRNHHACMPKSHNNKNWKGKKKNALRTETHSPLNDTTMTLMWTGTRALIPPLDVGRSHEMHVSFISPHMFLDPHPQRGHNWVFHKPPLIACVVCLCVHSHTHTCILTLSYLVAEMRTEVSCAFMCTDNKNTSVKANVHACANEKNTHIETHTYVCMYSYMSRPNVRAMC